MSRDMTKPTKWLCAQRRHRSAWASTRSVQHLRCPHEETLGPWLFIERTAKTLIRLGGCPGWSKFSLGAYTFCWFSRDEVHIISQIAGSWYRQLDVSFFPLGYESNYNHRRRQYAHRASIGSELYVKGALCCSTLLIPHLVFLSLIFSPPDHLQMGPPWHSLCAPCPLCRGDYRPPHHSHQLSR